MLTNASKAPEGRYDSLDFREMLFGSHLTPPSGIVRGKIPVPDSSCSGGKHLHASDPRVSVSAATQILDRAYGRPVQSIDANINDDPVRYIVELPKKSATTQEWLEDIRREDAGRSLVNGAAAVDDKPTH